MEIQTYIHAFINMKLHNIYILFLSHLPSYVLKLMSVLHEVIRVGIEFQRDARAKEKLVLNRSILGLREILRKCLMAGSAHGACAIMCFRDSCMFMFAGKTRSR